MVEFFKQYITAKNVIFVFIMLLFLHFIAQIKDIAILFFASYVISCSLNPLVDKLSKKMKRESASAIVLVGSILILVLFLVPVLIMGGYQVKALFDLLPAHAVKVKEFLVSLPFIPANNISQISFSSILSSAGNMTSDIVSEFINVGTNVASATIYFLAGILITFYFLADRDRILKGYLLLFPNNMKEKAEDIIKTISEKIGGYVAAQLLTMFSVGFIMFVGLLMLKIDYALILGLITGIFDIVPVVGPAVALVVILLTLSKLSLIKICLVILIFIFAQWAENNLVRPYVFGKFMDIHPLIIYLFLFVTAQYLGVVGVIFAPAIAATMCVLIEELYIKSINS